MNLKVKEVRVEVEDGSMAGASFAEFNRNLREKFIAAGIPVEICMFSDHTPHEVEQEWWIGRLRRAGVINLRTVRNESNQRDIIILTIPDPHG